MSVLDLGVIPLCPISSMRLRQNGCHFADDMYKHISLYGKCCILIQINNMPTLVQIMACHQTGDKPLSKPMMAIFCWCYNISLLDFEYIWELVPLFLDISWGMICIKWQNKGILCPKSHWVIQKYTNPMAAFTIRSQFKLNCHWILMVDLPGTVCIDYKKIMHPLH